MEYHGIKAIGHALKKILPTGVFTQTLAVYHKLVGVAAMPKAYFAMRRVERSIEMMRKRRGKIRFGFYVVLDAMFLWRHVFELMLKDERFDPFIVVVPRIGYQDGDMVDTVEKTYASLVKAYGSERIFRGLSNGVFDNRIGACDACTMSNLYRGLAVKEFETEYFARRGVPILVSSYYYDEGTVHSPEFYGMSSLKYVYRFYCSHEVERDRLEKYQHWSLKSNRTVCVGCAKTDDIVYSEVPRSGSVKTILLAPHHSVIPSVDSGICIGNFLKYKDLFLSLPKKYPQIHWIFRPHPHLRLRLTKDYTWKMSDWENYVREWESNPNAEYEAGGAYYDSFERSDAIIQDCGSFLPEYFYTGKPCCYMLASEEAKKAQFDEWGQELLAHTYQAFSEEQITKFIEDVVIGGKDTMREMRHKFAKERVMINYPHASEAIVEDIAQLLGRGKETKA